MKKIWLFLLITVSSYAQAKDFTVAVTLDTAFSSSFDFAFHPAHAAAFGMKIEFQTREKIYFYSQIYLDYQLSSDKYTQYRF